MTYYFKSRPGTEEFTLEYLAWHEGREHRLEIGASRTKPGSVSALVVKFYRSAEWANLSDATKATYKGIIERFRVEHGHKPVARLERRHVRDIVAKKAKTPAAANNMLRMIRVLMRFAIEEEWRRDDPTLGIKSIRTRSGGFHTWTEDEIARFEKRWPVGTRERLAFSLLLHTAQRRGDVIHMGRQHVRDGKIRVVQHKTGATLSIPIHPDLKAVLDAHKSDHMTFLTTAKGEPFTAAGFGNWFREACDAAGLPKGCAAHGLRKAACRRLAEAGCSANVIASISGHATLKEVSRYTKAADQELLAEAAMRAIAGPEREQKLANRGNGLAKTGRKSL
ncbi:tyrosine-type recombinase/integrase [Methyloceanibacter methanicus]|uniref:tyrosine-type recombinase/integrase n=1 Tax=Methyloceanibacter methanicus TaxID=1774968 RepID=UPI001FCDB8B8|nr:tyrosine-type recombinase/integrase [Methyloceanibacter methanicus]